MKITFVEKKYKASPKLKDIITDKLSRLDKYFDGGADAKVVLSQQNKTEKMEVNLTFKGVLYRSEMTGNSNYENIDLVLPKLERQIVRAKQKYVKGRKTAKTESFEFLEEAPEMELADISRTKKFELEPITIEEAKDAIERLGHTFYIFLNAETGKVNVIYKRKDEKYGLIEVTY